MKKFIKLTAKAAYLDLVNIDTDMIIPKQFLKTIKRTGLGSSLFYEMRYDNNGNLIPDFILNRKEYENSKILITGDNFGCGSSREHAPWALLDFGIESIIAPSFADIFYNNCFKNGILPIILDKDKIEQLMNYATDSNNELIIDLELEKIYFKNSELSFDIDSKRKYYLLNGLDDIDLTLQKEGQISNFEQNNKKQVPWLWQE